MNLHGIFVTLVIVLITLTSFTTGQQILYSFGRNDIGQFGNGSTHSYPRLSTPAPSALGVLAGTHQIALVSVGNDFTMIQTLAGNAYGYGTNDYGQLGDGTIVTRTEPSSVVGVLSTLILHKISASKSGFFTLFMTSTGTVFATGRDNQQQLGINFNPSGGFTPTPVELTTGLLNIVVKDISAGEVHALACDDQGVVYAWGDNSNHRVGVGTTGGTTSTPVAITNNLNGFLCAEVSAGRRHSVMRTTSNEVFSWGYNGYGQLSIASTSTQTYPVRITNTDLDLNTVKICAGNEETIFLTSSGTLFGAGRNNEGALGDGTFTQRTNAVQVGLSQLSTRPVSIFDCWRATVAVTSANEVYTFGYNADGLLGHGYSKVATRNYPVQVKEPFLGQSLTRVSVGSRHASILATVSRACNGLNFDNINVCSRNGACMIGTGSNGQCTCFPGYNGTNCDRCAGNFGNYPACDVCTGDYLLPSCTQRSRPGHLYGWGLNNYGQFGNGSTFQSPFVTGPIPNALGALSQKGNIISASLGREYTMVVTDSGEVWGMGSNTYGQLGDSSVVSTQFPVKAVALGLHRVTQVEARHDHTAVLTSEGRIFTFGYDQYGQLCLPISTVSTPTEVLELLGVKIVDLTTSNHATLAISNDGFGYGCGRAIYGIMANLVTTDSSNHSPQPMTGMYGEFITQISSGDLHSLAINEKGQVIAQGYGGEGQMGRASTSNNNHPLRIEHDLVNVFIVKVEACYRYSLFLGSDGVLYGSGRNGYGELGQSHVSNVNVPVRVGGEQLQFKTIIDFHCRQHTLVITTEGLIYAFGRNDNGELNLPLSVTHTGVHPFNIIKGRIEGQQPLKVYAGLYHSAAIVQVDRQCAGSEFNATGVCNGHGECSLGVGASGSCVCTHGSRFTGPNCDQCHEHITNAPACDTCETGYDGPDCNIRPRDQAGALYTFGLNQYGQFGNGSTNSAPFYSTPTLGALGTLAGTRSIVDVIQLYHSTLVLTSDNKVYGMGRNDLGQLGDLTFTQRLIPTESTLLTPNTIIKIDGREHALAALTNDGRVLTWGYSQYSQTCRGTTSNFNNPGEVTNLLGIAITDVGMANHHFVASTLSGGIFGCGYAGNGRIGNGVTSGSTYNTPQTATSVFGLFSKHLYVSSSTTHVINEKNELWSFGYGAYGTIGDGTHSTNNVNPAKAVGALEGKIVKRVKGCHEFILAIDSDDVLYAWGRNNEGEIGDSTIVQKHSPVVWGGEHFIGKKVRDFNCYHHTVVLTTDNQIWFSGDNSNNQFGIGQYDRSDVPVLIDQGPLVGLNAIMVSAGEQSTSVLVVADRQCSGIHFDQSNVCNNKGKCQLGSGTSGLCICDEQQPFIGANCDQCRSPFLTGANCDQCKPGFFGLDCERQFSTGSLYAWGENDFGQFGNGTSFPSNQLSTPTLAALGSLAGERNFLQVAAGYDYAQAIVNNQVYSWGANSIGELGDTTTTSPRTSPVLSVNMAGLSIIHVSVFYQHTAAITNDGRLFTWGAGDYGKHCHATTSHFSTPTEVPFFFPSGILVNDVSAGYAHTVIATSKGEIYGCGYAGNGRIGNGVTSGSSYTSPVLGTSLSSIFVKRVSSGYSHTMLLSLDNKIFGVGTGNYGELGNGGASTNNANPSQLSGLLIDKNITRVESCIQYTLVLTNENILYGFGRNDRGELGIETTSQQNAPVIVGGVNFIGKTVRDFACKDHTVIVFEDNTVWAMGRNNEGQADALGTASITQYLTPVRVDGPLQGQTVNRVVAGYGFTIAQVQIDRQCFGVEFDDPNVCSQRGDCILGVGVNGQCLCDSEFGSTFTGPNCNDCRPLFTGSQCDQCIAGHFGPDCTRTFKSGSVFGWGSNYAGQLGNGTTLDKPFVSTPIRAFSAGAFNQVQDIAAGYEHSLILSNFKVYATGDNQYGQLGDQSTISKSTPVPVTLPPVQFIKISTLGYHSLVLTNDGRIYSFGLDDYGQLGLVGSTTSIATEIPNFNGIQLVDIAAGYSHSLATTKQGILYGWGRAANMRIGNGVTSNNAYHEPQLATQFNSLKIVQVYAGNDHSFAIDDLNRKWGFGYGGRGEIGYGSTCTHCSPLQTIAPVADKAFKKLCLGFQVTFIVLETGELYGYGRNNYNQLGDGTTNNRASPIFAGGPAFALKKFEDVSCRESVVALTVEGELYTWGRNIYGQSARGIVIPDMFANPIKIEGPLAGQNIVSLHVGWSFAMAIVNVNRECNGVQFNSTSVCSGNGDCVLGSGSSGVCVCRRSFAGSNCEQCGGNYANYPTCTQCVSGFKGPDCDIPVGTTGSVYVWGSNEQGQFGNGTTFPAPYVSMPTLGARGVLSTSRNIADIQLGDGHSVLLTGSGDVYSFGRNVEGQLGEQTFVQRNEPQYVGTLSSHQIVKVSTYYRHSMALTSTGRIFVWGLNNYGQLGITSTNTANPTEIVSLNGHIVTDIAAGTYHSLVATSNGYGFGMGFRSNGRLGDSVASSGTYNYPVVFSTHFVGQFIKRVYAGDSHSFYLTSEGIARGFGYGGYGEMGFGSTCTNCLIPAALTGPLLNKPVKDVCVGTEFTLVLSNDNHLYGFGRNTHGELGDTTFTSRSTPILAGGALIGPKNIVSMDCRRTTLVLTSDGDVYAWGLNDNGELGLGSLLPPQNAMPMKVSGPIDNQSPVLVRLGYTHAAVVTNSDRVCNGIAYDQATVCSGHGECALGNGVSATCVCKNRFDGAQCNQCAGNFNNYPSCDQCTSGFYGPNCDIEFYSGNTLMGWGSNDYGQFGNGTVVATAAKSTPTPNALGPLAGLRNIFEIAAGEFHSLILADNKVYGYGFNGQGQLGDETIISRSLPVESSLPSDVKNNIVRISSQYQHSMALSSSGRVFSWGADTYGQLGLLSSNVLTPTEVIDLTGIVITSISAGYVHSIASDRNGFGYGWGYENSGRLGIGSTSNNHFHTPTLMKAALIGQYIKDVRAGHSHSSILTPTGQVFSFGYGGRGAIGNSRSDSSNNPQLNEGLLTTEKIIKIRAGYEVTVALSDKNELFGWGRNDVGTLGDSTFTNRNAPIRVGGAEFANIKIVDMSVHRQLVVVTDQGVVWTVGEDASGELGRGFVGSNINIPIIVGHQLNNQRVIRVSAGYTFTLALTDIQRNCSGVPFDQYASVCSGHGSCSSGSGSNGICDCDFYYPGANCDQCSSQYTNYPACDQCIPGFKGPDCNIQYSTGNAIYVWGANTAGQFGNGTTQTIQSTPVLGGLGILSGLGDFEYIDAGHSSAYVIRQGKLYAWGSNAYGQLGDSSTTNRDSPIAVNMPVAVENSIVKVSAGLYHAVAFSNDGRIFSWGNDDQGQLGNIGGGVTFPTEIQEFVGKIIVDVAAGYQHSLAVTREGSTFGFGYRCNGRIGDNVVSCSAIHTPIVSVGLSGQFITRVHAGYDFSMAVNDRGSIFGFGYSGYGSVGNGAYNTNNNPSQVLGLLENRVVKEVCAGIRETFVIADDKKVYGWGRNNIGQLGDSSVSTRASPILVGGGAFAVKNFIHIGCYHTTIAITEDGLIYVTGQNSNANLGFGYTNPSNVRIPLLLEGPLKGQTPIYAAAGTDFSMVIVNVDRRCNDTQFNDPNVCNGHGICNLGVGAAGVCSCELDFPGETCNNCKPQFTNYPLCDQCIPGFIGTDCTRKLEGPGTAYAWGSNNLGQFGNGTVVDSIYVSTPTMAAPSLSRQLNHLASGVGFVAAIAGGRVYTWGSNTYGQVGDQTVQSRLEPYYVQVLPVSETFVKVDTYRDHVLALTATGRVYSWGHDEHGKLGLPIGTTGTPNEIPNLIGKLVTDIAAGDYHSLASLKDGTVFGWGYRDHGRIGDGSSSASGLDQPALSSSLIGILVSRVSAGHDHSIVMNEAGKIFCIGRSNYGQCHGNGGSSEYTAPFNINGDATAMAGTVITKFIAGTHHSLILDNTGTLWGFGRNNYGQLGDQTTSVRYTAIKVANGALFGKIVVDFSIHYHSVVATQNGEIWVFGDNREGELGLGEKIPTTNNNPLLLEGVVKGQSVVHLSAGPSHTIAIFDINRQCNGVEFDNATVCNGHGNCDLGLGANGQCICQRPFTGANCDQCSGNFYGPNCNQCINGFIGVDCEKRNDGLGVVYAWGDNQLGQFGNGTTLAPPLVSSPTLGALGTLSGTRSIFKVSAGTSHVIVISDGKIYSYGLNSNGQLGDGTTDNRNEPVAALAAGQYFVDVSTYHAHTLALTSNGETYSWGIDTYGGLGRDGALTIPSLITGLIGIKISDISAGYWHSLATVLNTGEVYGFGYSCTGRLGDTTSGCTSHTTPRIVLSTISLPVKNVYAGYTDSIVRTYDHKIYGFGANNYGQLGLGHSSDIYSAINLHTTTSLIRDKTIAKVCMGVQFTLLVTEDQKVYGMGRNNYYQLGDDTTTTRNQPILVGGTEIQSKNIVDIACYYQSLLVTDTGEVFAFGNNDYAQIGTGSANPSIHSIPYKLTDPLQGQTIRAIAAGERFSLALVNATRECIGVQFDSSNVCSGHGKCDIGVGNQFSGTQCVCNPKYAGANCDKCSGFFRNYPACDECVNGFHGPSCEPLVTGILYGWGRNEQGQFGDATSNPRYTPAPIVTSGSIAGLRIQKFAAGHSHTVVVVEGEAWSFGSNSYGQLGIGSYNTINVPEKVVNMGGRVIFKVQASERNSYFLTETGALFSTGHGGSGELGVSSAPSSVVAPLEVITFFQQGKTVADISSTNRHVLACTTDGVLYAWGLRTSGQLGDGSTSGSRSLPHASNPSNILSGVFIKRVYAGYQHSIVMTDKGRLYGFGSNAFGQLAININGGTYASPQLIQPVIANRVVKDVCTGRDHTIFLMDDNTLLGAGENDRGLLGRSDIIRQITAVPIGGTTFEDLRFKGISCWETLSAVTTDGRVFTTGLNNDGQLGTGSNTPTFKSIPQEVKFNFTIESSVMARTSGFAFASNGSDIITCFGVASIDPNVCGGHGSCVSPDVCNCDTGYGSNDCDELICFGKLQSNPTVCTSHGACTGVSQCTCVNGYSQQDCSLKRTCQDLDFDDTTVCSNHGTCTGIDVCTCNAGYATANCSLSVCFGLEAEDAAVCSGHGVCNGPDDCSCETGFTGPNCQFFICDGQSSNASTVCSGHGTCSDVSVCDCVPGYDGAICDIVACFGVQSNDSNTCSGHGNCTAPNTCVCDHTYLSDNCAFSCPETELTNPLKSIHLVDTSLEFIPGGTVKLNVSQSVIYRDQQINITLLSSTVDEFDNFTYHDACDYNNIPNTYYTDLITDSCRREVVHNIPFTTWENCQGLVKSDIVVSNTLFYLYQGVYQVRLLNPITVNFGVNQPATTYLKRTTVYKRFALRLQKEVTVFTPLNVTSDVEFFAAAIRQEYNYDINRLEILFFFVAEITGGPNYVLEFDTYNGTHPITVTQDTFTCPGVFETEFICQKFKLSLDNEGECSFNRQRYDLGFHIECNNCFVQNERVFVSHTISMSDVCEVVDEQFDVQGSLSIYSDQAHTQNFPIGGIGVNSTAHFVASFAAPFAPMTQAKLRDFYLCSLNDIGSCTDPSAKNVLVLKENDIVTSIGSGLQLSTDPFTGGQTADFTFDMKLAFCDLCFDRISRLHLNESNGEIMFHATFVIGYTDDPLKKDDVQGEDTSPVSFSVVSTIKTRYDPDGYINYPSTASSMSTISFSCILLMTFLALFLL